MPRLHLASLIDDFRAHATETAVVEHRGVRSYRTSYGELATMAGRFAAELAERGIGPGERVLLWGANGAPWIAVFFGCLLRGVLVVPLDTAGSPEFASRVLADVSPRLVVADAGKLPLLRAAMAGRNTASLDLSGLAQVLPDKPDFRVDPVVEPDSPFQIIFTSGTTSEPKGIVHTHRNVLASLTPIETEIAKYRRYERWVHPLRFLHTLPLSHVFGQFMGLWIPGVLGAELHFSDALDAGRVVALIRHERVSVLVAVPRVLALLRAFLLSERPGLQQQLDAAAGVSMLKRWWRFRDVHRQFGLKFWAVISGGASLPPELEQFWNRLGFALVQGYGMTETAALVTLNHPFRIGQGTIGKALPGREVRLSDTGELLVRGDVVARSEWKGGRLQQRNHDWLATGDLAEQNEAGEFRFVGRKGDSIVTSSGLNVHPADLEAAMLRQPGVQGCAVVPCEFPTGPEPVCIVLFAGDDAALDRVVRAANAELAEFQQMRRVLRWPEVAFPYTSTGKLLRRTIRDWACRAVTTGAVDSPAFGDPLLQAIASVTGEAVPFAPQPGLLRLSEDLHLDSLGRIQLASAIEQRTGVLLSDAAMASVQTLGDLREAIALSLAPAQPAIAARSDAHAPGTMPVTRSTSEPKQGSVVPAARPEPVATQATYPRWPWIAPMRWVRTFFLEAVVRPLIGLFLAPQVVLTAPSPRGPMLLVANHVTMLDPALVLYALPAPRRRELAVMMSGEILADFRSGRRAGVAGRAAYWLLTALFNVFPLPQLQGFRQSFAHAGKALDRGMSVLIFPEGARSKTGTMAPFRSGIGLLAAKAGVPVLPVALIGLERIRPRGARWFRSDALQVRMGEAIAWSADRTPEQWTAELETHVRALVQRPG
ncbi:AMP-binding protein [Terriglobus sp.]|uniref:AMP-binding protein n=1 Tax=Terriglobus sp. TaxID=1889013 RepID=UPI003B00A39C